MYTVSIESKHCYFPLFPGIRSQLPITQTRDSSNLFQFSFEGSSYQEFTVFVYTEPQQEPMRSSAKLHTNSVPII